MCHLLGLAFPPFFPALLLTQTGKCAKSLAEILAKSRVIHVSPRPGAMKGSALGQQLGALIANS